MHSGVGTYQKERDILATATIKKIGIKLAKPVFSKNLIPIKKEQQFSMGNDLSCYYLKVDQIFKDRNKL